MALIDDIPTSVQCLLPVVVCVQTCYGLMWPTLGGGTILAVQPSPEQMSKVRQDVACNDVP